MFDTSDTTHADMISTIAVQERHASQSACNLLHGLIIFIILIRYLVLYLCVKYYAFMCLEWLFEWLLEDVVMYTQVYIILTK